MKTFSILKKIIPSFVLLIIVVLLISGFILRNPIRTLLSFKRIPKTNMYVMEYYGDYNIDEVYKNGIDIKNIEKSIIRVYFPNYIEEFLFKLIPGGGVVRNVKYKKKGYACSTVSFMNENGNVFFGRNLDWEHDACLILKIHSVKHYSSVAMLDLKYLDLDNNKLQNVTILDRIKLLLAPYIAMDGFNEYGLAISEMTACKSKIPNDPNKPDVYNTLLHRLILDYSKNVDEALELIKKYNIYFPETPCHFMLCDASGKSVVVEFINYEMKLIESDTNWNVCTNHLLFGRTESENDSICKGYRIASNSLSNKKSDMTFTDLVKIMSDISIEDRTMWTSFYNLTSGDFLIAYRRNYQDLYKSKLKVLK